MYRAQILLILLGFLVTACESTQTLQPTPTATNPPKTQYVQTPDASPAWELEFHMSGGIAGINQSLSMDSEGVLVVRDDEKEVLCTTLSQKRTQRIASLISDAVSSSAQDKAAKGIPEPCPDCFLYQIRLTWGEERIHIKVDDSRLPESPYQPLIHTLKEHLREAQNGEMDS